MRLEDVEILEIETFVRPHQCGPGEEPGSYFVGQYAEHVRDWCLWYIARRLGPGQWVPYSIFEVIYGSGRS